MDMNEIRAEFIRRGDTVAQFARRHGFNPTLAHRAILGTRGGPKHEKFRRLLSTELEKVRAKI